MVCLKAMVLLTTLSAGGNAELLDFSADWCSPCRMMEPTIARLEADGTTVRRINIDHQPELSARFRVSSVPCFVAVVDGREVERIVGATSYDRLRQMMVRADGQITQSDHLIRAQSPDNARRGISFPSSQMAPPPLVPVPPSTGSYQTASRDTSASPPPSSRRSRDGQTTKTALLASVRLKIDDPRGHSYGSGTIVDVHGAEALILTCGHIFRDSKGAGRITVDLFLPDGHQSVAGRLVSYDLESDVALVSIRPGTSITPIRIAPRNQRISSGTRVFTIGCDRGGPPRLEESHITSIDKYLGPSNVQVAGQPVDGRSGGGLFTTDGLLIGVCNAADPQNNEGFFASFATVQAELDEMGLTFIYDDAENPVVNDQPINRDLVKVAPTTKDMPNLPKQMPRGSGLKNQLDDQLSATELDLIRRSAVGAEVICIVRSLADPGGKSQVIVLDKASPAFVNLLAKEMRGQSAGKPASMQASREQSETLQAKQPNNLVRGQSPRR